MRTICTLLAMLCLCSCKRVMPDKVLNEETKSVQDTTHLQEPVISNPKAFIAAVNEFITAREDVKQKIGNLTLEQADSLYDVYLPKCYEKIGQMEHFEETFISNYYSYVTYNDNGDITKAPDSIQRKINLLNKAGLEIWDIGEGMVEIRPVPDYFLNLFKGHVSPGYQDFMALEAEDDKILFDNDASITIPWKDVATRVLNWENFIAKYPDIKPAKVAADHYHYYQYAFLVGADNTPVLDENKIIYPEMREAFEDFIEKHPESPTSALVKQVIEFKGDWLALDKFIAQQQKLQEGQK